MSDLRLSTVADYARSLLIDAMQNMLYKFLLCLRQQGMAAYPDDTSRPRFTNESNAQVLLKETHTPRATIRCGLPQGSPRIAAPDPAFSRPFFFSSRKGTLDIKMVMASSGPHGSWQLARTMYPCLARSAKTSQTSPHCFHGQPRW